MSTVNRKAAPSGIHSLERSQLPKVFISYSRSDLAWAERLRDKLVAGSYEAYLDKHDILPGEPWQERLGRLIEMADTVVFLLSPDSVASTICDWEVCEAERLEKRILPIVVRDPSSDKVPGRLRRLNYIFMRNLSEELDGFDRVLAAILTDIDWIREHTRIGISATDWQRSNRSGSLLLRGESLVAAELWISKHPREAPEPTRLHREFIQQSRKADAIAKRRFVLVTVSVAILFVGISVSTGIFYIQAHPQCDVASVYSYATGRFQKAGAQWEEYNPNGLFSTFRELRSDGSYVYLADSNRVDPIRGNSSDKGGREFFVRIPRCGGVADWSWSNPIQWIQFQIVSR